MLMPKKTKFRKSHRGRRKGNSKGGNTVNFGDYGIQAVETSYVTGRQIEAARITITRTMKRGGKVWINIFPHKPVTQKPAEVRMGSGKGNVEYYVAVVKPGRIIFEISVRLSFRKRFSFTSSCIFVLRSKIGNDAHIAGTSVFIE